MKRTAILIAVLLAFTLSCVAQTQTTSTHLKFKNGLSTDSIGSDTGDSLIIDGEGLLKFRDVSAGTVYLIDIPNLEDSITKHTDTLQVHQDQIAALFDTTALHLDSLQLHQTQIAAFSATQEWTPDANGITYADNVGIGVASHATNDLAVAGTSSFGGLLTVNGGTLHVRNAIEIDTRFTINATSVGLASIYYWDEGDLLMQDLRIGASASNEGIYWDDSENRVGILDDTPSYTLDVNGTGRFIGMLTVDDITLPTAGDKIYFGTTNDIYIQEGGLGQLQFIVGSGQRASLNTTELMLWNGVDIMPQSNKGSDVGSSGLFFNNGYLDQLYLDATSNYIDVSGTDMIFTDGSNTNVTLSTLVSGGSSDSAWTSIEVDTVFFGDGDTYIKESMDDNLDFFVGGAATIRFTSSSVLFYDALIPSASQNIGDSSTPFGTVFADEYDQTVISHSLTDGAPTDAQIDAATSTTPSVAGSGRKYLILDSDGSALMYIIISDGTNWQYTAMTIAT